MDKEFSEEFSLYFGSEINQISSKALASALHSLNVAVDGINSSLNNGKEVSFQVRAFEPGSFNVPGEIIQYAADLSALVIPNHSFLPDILKILKDLYLFKKEISGDKIKHTEEQSGNGNVKIETENGNVTYIDNRVFNTFKNNTSVTEAIDSGLLSLKESPEVKSFEMRSGKTDLIHFSREEIEKYKPSPYTGVRLDDNEKIEHVNLNIFKLVFDKKRKWEFICKGHKISAPITDASFHEKVINGERFAQGDSLYVELKTQRKFDKATNTYINVGYEIAKVMNHIPRSEQQELGFGG